MKRFQKIFLFLIILLLSNYSLGDVGRVGVLMTSKESYPHELDYSNNVIEMVGHFSEMEGLRIDYNELVSRNGDLESVLRDFIEENNITKVIIPGNYYNLDSAPFAPNSNRQDVTGLLVKIAGEQKIRLLGICGGLQGIVHSQGIELVKVKDIKGDVEKHLISDPNPQSPTVPLGKVRLNPFSNLAKIIQSHIDSDLNGWMNLYLPDAHSRVINNSVENIMRLENAGYRVIGFSQDGMIEIIEDKVGNVHFQGHPEGLVIASQQIGNRSSLLRGNSTNAMIEFFKYFISG